MKWRPGGRGRKAPIALATLALLPVAPVFADDWSSVGEAVQLASILLAFHALQLLVSAGLALHRGRRRGWKSGLAYFGGALLMVPATYLLLALLAPVADKLSATSGLAGMAVFAGLPALAIWLAFVVIVREHDRQPENQVWKQTR